MRLVAVATYSIGHPRAPWQPQIIRIPDAEDFPRETIWSSIEYCKHWLDAQTLANEELARLPPPKISAKNAGEKPVLAKPKVDRQVKPKYNLDDV